MNRGSTGGGKRTMEKQGASMRPRFMNRGSHVVSHHRGEELRASMRPRFMNRGSARAWILPTYDPSSFNEAPIHESGKCGPDCV